MNTEPETGGTKGVKPLKKVPPPRRTTARLPLEGVESPQSPAPVEGVSPPEPVAEVKRPQVPQELPTEAESPQRPYRPPLGAARLPLERVESPQSPAPVEKVSPPEPVAEVETSQGTPERLGVSPVENGSVYFIPYKYYLASETMVFSKPEKSAEPSKAAKTSTEAGNELLSYQEFLRAMRGKISGSGYDEKEAAVVCQIFERDMRLMFYEKAIQEIGERGFGLTQMQKDRWSSFYREQLQDEKEAFRVRKTSSPPPGFGADALWFASFSDRPAPCLSSAGEHAGSIYFDGGRIRLMHAGGPAVKRGMPVRTLGGKILLEKPETAKAKANLEALVQQAKREGRPATLIEFGTGGGKHTSRGCPKIVDLIDEDIAQLYYLADRITALQSGGEYENLRRQGISGKQIISAGNKLMAEFIGGHVRLKAALGYC